MPKSAAILIRHDVRIEEESRVLKPQLYKDCGTRPAVHGCGYPPVFRRAKGMIEHNTCFRDCRHIPMSHDFWRNPGCVLRQEEECRRSGFIPIAMRRRSSWPSLSNGLGKGKAKSCCRYWALCESAVIVDFVYVFGQFGGMSGNKMI